MTKVIDLDLLPVCALAGVLALAISCLLTAMCLRVLHAHDTMGSELGSITSGTNLVELTERYFTDDESDAESHDSHITV